MQKIMSIFGTRPEAIKMAPLVNLLKNDNRFLSTVVVTGQHREMLDQVLSLFKIKPDYDLNIMSMGQSLTDIASRIMTGLAPILEKEQPDVVLVHGDTTTALIASLTSYYAQIPVYHVEAGLRTGNLYSPWPEEGNRKVIGALAQLHFAPTPEAMQNLISEGIDSEDVHITGNTVIDSLLLTKERIYNDPIIQNQLDDQFSFLDKSKKLLLVTGHRRESFGDGFKRLCIALTRIATEHTNCEILYPVHLNPHVQKIVKEHLGGVANVHLVEPLDYQPFVYIMSRSHIILTDSGGIQEEAPSLGKPVLVLRDTTERPEAVEAGTVKLVGTNVDLILTEINRLLFDQSSYDQMSEAYNPYGDGTASERIINIIAN